MQFSQESDHLRFDDVQLSDLPDLAERILNAVMHPVNLLEAPMGTGKTTLCNAILSCWGSEDGGASPTFSLIQEHSGPQGKLFHMDAYRLEHEDEAYDFGLEEYLESGHPVWIEWADRIKSFLPYQVGVVYLDTAENFTRSVKFYPSLNIHQITLRHE